MTLKLVQLGKFYYPAFNERHSSFIVLFYLLSRLSPIQRPKKGKISTDTWDEKLRDKDESTAFTVPRTRKINLLIFGKLGNSSRATIQYFGQSKRLKSKYRDSKMKISN